MNFRVLATGSFSLYHSVLGISLGHDITLPNGQATRHPSVNLFFDDIHERLQKAMDICEKTPLGRFLQHSEPCRNLFFIANISGEIVRIDPKVRQALNFIETGNDDMYYY